MLAGELVPSHQNLLKSANSPENFGPFKKKNDKFIFQKANGMIDFFYTKVTFITLILKRENLNVKIESIIKMFFLDNKNNIVK